MPASKPMQTDGRFAAAAERQGVSDTEERTTMPEADLDFGFFEAECHGCELFGGVNDLGLCAGCSAMLDRDMIRQRAWEHSVTALGVPAEKYEQLRRATIARYGAALELIAPAPEAKKRRRKRSGRRRR